jgi:tetratricopeptide (TPR) repeat protein
MKPVIVFFLMSLFVSCISVRSIEIETYNPAAITFPDGIKTVMIVNNSAQQPDGVGHRYMHNGKDDSTVAVSADSLAYGFCRRLGEYVAESPVFGDVRLCRDTLRRDSVFYEKRTFSASEVQAFCDDYGVDALILLENFVFLTEAREERINSYTFESSIRVNLFGELRAMWPGQKEVYTFPFSDSIKWLWPSDFYFNPYEAAITASDVREAMLCLSEIVAGKMHVNFAPYWSMDSRWYYTSAFSDWKRGAAHAAAGKWSEAGELWDAILRRTSKWDYKARLFSNLSLCHEIGGDFEKATGYAEQSYRLFEENAGADDAYTKLQKRYLEILKERTERDKTLSGQLRE